MASPCGLDFSWSDVGFQKRAFQRWTFRRQKADSTRSLTSPSRAGVGSFFWVVMVNVSWTRQGAREMVCLHWGSDKVTLQNSLWHRDSLHPPWDMVFSVFLEALSASPISLAAYAQPLSWIFPLPHINTSQGILLAHFCSTLFLIICLVQWLRVVWAWGHSAMRWCYGRYTCK